MGQLLDVTEKAAWFRLAWKSIALAASTGAALVTVFSALYSYGVVGKAESHQSIGNIGAAWVGLRPAIDTATAIGDTVHYAATIADKNGSILIGARPVWTTGDSMVARVLPDGSVIARGPGTTTVSVVVGTLVAHSHVLVRQRVAVVELVGPAQDSVVVIPEGARIQLQARALDARGHAVAGMAAEWHADDSTTATLDGHGVLVGRIAGRTSVTATVAGIVGRSPVNVITTASALALAAGTAQHAPAGSTLPQPLVIRATNRRGAPVPGQTVRFRLADHQGSIDPASVVTDADGRARTTWTLGETPGRQTLFASVEQVDSALAVTAEADPVAANTRVVALQGDLSGRAGTVLGDSIVGVRITDSTGRALGDVAVRWVALDGSAVEVVGARSDSLGVARARWTLASRTGTQRLRAQVGAGTGRQAIAPVTIAARATAGAPAAITVVAGDGQRAAAGSALAKSLVLRVADAAGNGVADAVLSFSPSGGTLSDSTMHTDSLGIARVRWTLGHSAGAYTLGARAQGVKASLKLAARAAPGAPANLSFDDVPAERHARGAKGKRLDALVTDVYGNPVPDTKVTFSVKSGTITPARAVTDARGRVALHWTPGHKAGEQTIVGSVRATDVTGRYSTEVGAHVASAAPSSAKTAQSSGKTVAASRHDGRSR
jgi:adhesin/invasin